MRYVNSPDIEMRAPSSADAMTAMRQLIETALQEETCTINYTDDCWLGDWEAYVPNYTITIKVGGGSGIRRNQRILRPAVP